MVYHFEAIQAFSRSALPRLDIVATAVFAISGALQAAKARQNIVTFAFFAAVTGVGGGTVRDLLMGAPVFWVHTTTPMAACLVMALLVWFTPTRWWPHHAIDWFDGMGVAAYGVYGAAKAQAYGVPWLPAAVLGVVTACMGGIFRDVLANVPSIVIRPELYVTAAALSAGCYVLLAACGVPQLVATTIAFAAGFALRGAAIRHGINLPAYRRS